MGNLLTVNVILVLRVIIPEIVFVLLAHQHAKFVKIRHIALAAPVGFTFRPTFVQIHVQIIKSLMEQNAMSVLLTALFAIFKHLCAIFVLQECTGFREPALANAQTIMW